MTTDQVESNAEDGEVIELLHDLKTIRAPDRLPGNIMIHVGLADSYFQIASPIGPVFVAYNRQGISAIDQAELPDAFERHFRQQFHRSVYPSAESADNLRRALIDHLEGRRRSLRFDLRGLSEFEQAVLRKALEIPRGEIRPYAWIAREIGHPRAVRAVGSALAHNPIPLAIPCHRVVRSDGVIGNYGLGGTTNKRTILQWEGVDAAEVERLAREGVRFVGSDTTGIYCFPTCRHARRVTSQHRQHFHSEREAAEAGYRPCKVCRPAA